MPRANRGKEGRWGTGYLLLALALYGAIALLPGKPRTGESRREAVQGNEPLAERVPERGSASGVAILDAGKGGEDASPVRQAPVSRPFPKPAAASPSDRRNGPPVEPSRKPETVEDYKRRAVERYPDLGKAGTAMNGEFVRRYRLFQVIYPDFFSQPDWPVRLAELMARDLSVPADRQMR